MQVLIDDDGVLRHVTVEDGSTVLDVLQEAGVEVQAPCGGAGKCRRCSVLVRDAQGLSPRLACVTPVSQGMEIVARPAAAMEVVQSGVSAAYPPDGGIDGFGMAVDLGTTTLVAHLHSLRTGERLATVSRINPQVSFGADVMSRISASMHGSLDAMHDVVVDALRDMKAKLCAAAKVPLCRVVRTAIAGNTVMLHITAGLPPDSMGVVPYAPLSLFGREQAIEGVGPCYFARCIAGTFGGDLTAGMVALGFDDGGTRLLLDLGTNGEVALAHHGRIACCSTAAGPVFEGAEIHFGMPAALGAISAVAWDGSQLRLRVVGNVAPVGICGTGVIDAVAVMRQLGIIDKTGRLLGADELDAPLSSLVGREEAGKVFYLTPDRSLYLTQGDVRAVQLAKGAICAGIRILIDTVGIGIQDIATLEIAGGFGAYLNLTSAATIGLFPEELLGRAMAVGNTAAEGATALLLSSSARSRESAIADRCDYLELSTTPAFSKLFIRMLEFT